MRNEELAMRTFFSTVFGHRALDGWRGRDSHAPSLDGIHSTPGTLAGLREVDASLEPRGVRTDEIAMDTRHRERGWG